MAEFYSWRDFRINYIWNRGHSVFYSRIDITILEKKGMKMKTDVGDIAEEFSKKEEEAEIVESMETVLAYLQLHEYEIRKKIGHYKYEVLTHNIDILKNELVSKIEE